MSESLYNCQEIPAIMDVPQLGAFLGIGRNGAHALVRSGQVQALHIGRKIRIPRTVNKKISNLVGAIKRKNEFSSDSKALKVDFEGGYYEADMQALFKMIVSDLFFEIIAGYTAKRRGYARLQGR